ncbi:hypothetical protein HanXRQr2_Chr10g0421581 [Helianthus annuus]|uniref:Uncharacterized protein n=1 Tax=Helianthus annuus TaxID=4232 RepID=A0A9K3N3B7_HELAN|nr:hypothetical protein HanXRQr2_Chr10g0421581 [Helianthus annuus]
MNSNELVGDGDPSHCGLGSSIFINDNNFLSLMVDGLRSVLPRGSSTFPFCL